MATVVLLGTLDTKGAEYAYVRDRVAENDCDVIVIDAGILGEPGIVPDIDRGKVAEAAGVTIEKLVEAGDRGSAIEKMGRGAGVVLAELYEQGRVNAVFGMGGSNGSSLSGTAMQALPVGVPKLIVSTMASGDTRPYVGTTDVAMMYPVVDIAGINSVSARVLTNAAGAIAGMARANAGFSHHGADRPVVGATMFGVTTPGVDAAREWLENRGYEVLVFHATGTGGMALEALIDDGLIDAVLDVTTTELADEVVGGVLSAGPRRLEAAGAAGIPQVVSLGALDMANFGPIDTVPARYRNRNLHRHNPTVTLMRTSPEECTEIGRLIAAKLNAATGPLTLFIPRGGISALAAPGGAFHDPRADAALFQSLEDHLHDHVEVVVSDAHINDRELGAAMARRLHEHYSSRPGKQLRS